MGILLITNRCFERQWFLDDLQNLAHLLDRHTEFFPELFRRRLTTDLVDYQPPRAYNFVDSLGHVNGHADGARLIGERAGNRLPNPPNGIGRELIAAAVFELVDRPHQADVAFLDQVEELHAAIDVFLCNRDDQAQIGLHHLLFGLQRLALAFLHHMHNVTELTDLKAGLTCQRVNLRAQLLARGSTSSESRWGHMRLHRQQTRTLQLFAGERARQPSSRACFRIDHLMDVEILSTQKKAGTLPAILFSMTDLSPQKSMPPM